MGLIKTEEEIVCMREAGGCAAFVLDEVRKATKVGVSTWDLDQKAKEVMASVGAISSAYHYGAHSNPFPSYICVSLNNEVVHGIGKKDRIIKEGDIVSLDVALYYKGFAGDNTLTFAVGAIPKDTRRLIEATRSALMAGIDQARDGNFIGDIGYAIQTTAEKNHLGVVRDLVGHGIGRHMHEEPQVPNFGKPHTGFRLQAGMTIAIEPMFTLGAPKLRTLEDSWTIVTADNQMSAHFEHTVLITKDAPEILTNLKNSSQSNLL